MANLAKMAKVVKILEAGGTDASLTAGSERRPRLRHSPADVMVSTMRAIGVRWSLGRVENEGELRDGLDAIIGALSLDTALPRLSRFLGLGALRSQSR